MQKETKLEEILRLTLESLQKQEYSTETLCDIKRNLMR